MKHQKALNLLNEANDSKFVTRKWDIVSNNSKVNYNAGIKLSIVIINNNYFCDYNDAYILARRDITVRSAPATQVAFTNCAPFTKCITKIDETTIGAVEDLDLVMPMNNSIEYSSNYSETTGSLWFYSKDEGTNFNADIANNNNFKSFEYKAKLLGNTAAQPAPNAANGILKKYNNCCPIKIFR